MNFQRGNENWGKMFLGFEERFQKIGEIEKEGGTLGFGAEKKQLHKEKPKNWMKRKKQKEKPKELERERERET